MAPETRPNKRPRVEDLNGVDVVSPATGKRSEKYWFEDGNVILRVEDVLFRVYRGMLSRHSSVFHDMFAIPQPTTPDEDMVIDGCPVVVLSGDLCEDWENLLGVLYDCDAKYLKEEGQSGHKALISMLRLGHKYQIDFFFNEAVARLATFLPPTVDKWPGLAEKLSGITLFQLLGIMLEIGDNAFMPTIYFCCASLFDVETLFRIYREEPNIIQLRDLEQILSGRAKIVSVLTQQRVKWASLHSDAENRKKCAWNAHRSSPCSDMISKACEIDVIEPFLYLIMEPPKFITDLMFGASRLKACPNCVTAIATDQERSRVAFWDKLPSYFGLPDWKDLKSL